MIDSIPDYIKARRVVPAAPATFLPSLPDVDDDPLGDVEDFEPDLESVAGIGCVIEYLDSKGLASVRRITCRKISSLGGVDYVQAYCHERSQLRTFRIDRVTEVICGSTGEVFETAAEFFSRYSVANDGGSAIGFGLGVKLAADFRAGLNVLAFLGRADVRFTSEEKEAAEGFCRSFAIRLAPPDFDYEGAARHAANLAPDAETFYVSLARLKREGAPEGLSKLVVNWSAQLIAADGVQAPEEFHFGTKVEEYLNN
jgi:hypothetical protein